ncbi:MAG: 50S ribosomal protein L15, partial [Elusimicrobia bacterium]|nr:50S ribosomal protein L15 [Elusimicrobiota bacterium]MBD3412637.1 50S ribosomal protein L15 [Elusimicrobiota bacterium]
GERINVGFEGGQMPLIRRIPKRGFNHRRFRTVYAVINIGDLDRMFEANAQITPQVLAEKGLIRKNMPVRILGNGELKKQLTVAAHGFSGPAKEKIQAAGGSIQEVTR